MPSWEIFTYGGGAALLQLFNGIAAIMGNNDYLVLLKLTSLITVIWIIIEALFMRRPISIHPFIIVILVFYILFIPRVNVIISDRINPANSGVVANVPIGVGFTASMASNVGDWMSRTFDSVLSLPNDLQYSSNGLLFGSNLTLASSQFEITDSRLAGNVSEFMQQCVFYDILTGFYTWGDIVDSPDLWNMLQSTANPARSFQYQDTSGSKSIVTCPAGAALLNTDWSNEITRAQSIYGKRMFPGDPMAEAKFIAALPVSYAYMGNITTTAADAIRQNMMSNAVKRSLTRFAARADASAAAQDLALAQAEAQRSTTYSVLGELAGETLPLLRNVFEVLIYGMFPLFLILMFTPAAGKALMFYLKSVFWLQLWAPLYALLNLIMTSYSAQTGVAVATLPSGAQELTLATATALGAVNADIASIASYMAWMIPLISWGVINAGASMSMSMLASGLGSITQQAGSRAAADVSYGNVNIGNMGLYGQQGFKNDFAPSYAGGVGTMVDGQGTAHTVTPAGGTALKFQQSNLGFGTQIANAMRSSVSTQLSQSQESAWQKTAAYGQSLAANYGNMERFINQTSSGVGVGKEFRTQDGTSVQKEFGELTAIANNFASKYGVSHDQAVAMIGTAGIGGNIPLTKVGGEIKAQFSNQDTLQRAWTEVQQINDQTNFSERYQNLSSAVQSEAARISSEQNNALAKEVSSGLSQQAQYRDETQTNHREVDQWQQAKLRVDDQSFSFQGDVGMAVRRFMRNEQGLADAEIDTLIHSHNMGNTSSTAKLSDTVSQFAERHGKDLAGIHDTPTKTIIESNSETRFNEMSQNASHVQNDRTVNTDSVINLAQKAGTSTLVDINEEADSTMQRSNADINKTHVRIDHGKAGNSEKESAIHEIIDEKQRVYSAGSVPSIHETIDKVKTKLTNKFSELFK